MRLGWLGSSQVRTAPAKHGEGAPIGVEKKRGIATAWRGSGGHTHPANNRDSASRHRRLRQRRRAVRMAPTSKIPQNRRPQQTRSSHLIPIGTDQGQIDWRLTAQMEGERAAASVSAHPVMHRRRDPSAYRTVDAREGEVGRAVRGSGVVKPGEARRAWMVIDKRQPSLSHKPFFPGSGGGLGQFAEHLPAMLAEIAQIEAGQARQRVLVRRGLHRARHSCAKRVERREQNDKLELAIPVNRYPGILQLQIP